MPPRFWWWRRRFAAAAVIIIVHILRSRLVVKYERIGGEDALWFLRPLLFCEKGRIAQNLFSMHWQ